MIGYRTGSNVIRLNITKNLRMEMKMLAYCGERIVSLNAAAEVKSGKKTRLASIHNHVFSKSYKNPPTTSSEKRPTTSHTLCTGFSTWAESTHTDGQTGFISCMRFILLSVVFNFVLIYTQSYDTRTSFSALSPQQKRHRRVEYNVIASHKQYEYSSIFMPLRQEK